MVIVNEHVLASYFRMTGISIHTHLSSDVIVIRSFCQGLCFAKILQNLLIYLQIFPEWGPLYCI